jgi:hypothetical protein
VLGSFDHHAVEVEGKDTSVALLSLIVRNNGPLSHIAKSRILPIHNAAVRLSGYGLKVTIRDCLFAKNSASGLKCDSLHASVIQLSNVTLSNNGHYGMYSEGAHHNQFKISGSTFHENQKAGFLLVGVGNHILTHRNDASQPSIFENNRQEGLKIIGWYNTVHLSHADVIGNGDQGLFVTGQSWMPWRGLSADVIHQTTIEIADANFRQNLGGGVLINLGCTVRRYVVTRCTFYENHKYDLAMAGYVTAYDQIATFSGFRLHHDNGVSPEEVIRKSNKDFCIDRNVTIRGVHFDRFVQDKSTASHGRKTYIILLLRGKCRVCEKKLFEKYAGALTSGSYQGFSDETRIMYLARYGMFELNNNRIQLFGFPKIEMRDILIDPVDLDKERIDSDTHDQHHTFLAMTGLPVDPESLPLPELDRLAYPNDISIRYAADVSLQNVTMIRGSGITFRNVGRFNLSDVNVIDCAVGISFFSVRDYGKNGLVDYENMTGSIGTITGAIALNHDGDVHYNATDHVDYTPSRLFENVNWAERPYILYISEARVFQMTRRLIPFFWGLIVLAPCLNPRRRPLKIVLALDIFAGFTAVVILGLFGYFAIGLFQIGLLNTREMYSTRKFFKGYYPGPTVNRVAWRCMIRLSGVVMGLLMRLVGNYTVRPILNHLLDLRTEQAIK